MKALLKTLLHFLLSAADWLLWHTLKAIVMPCVYLRDALRFPDKDKLTLLLFISCGLLALFSLIWIAIHL